jgi:hypothetical protein
MISSKKFTKFAIGTSVVILFTSGMMATQASAASIKNGVGCSKIGANAKVGSKLYRCAKNPYVKPTQNTWTLRGCLTALAMWNDAKEQYADWVDLAKLAGADGQKTIDELQASITSLEETMKNVACKRGA